MINRIRVILIALLAAAGSICTAAEPAAEQSIGERLAFGNIKSDVHVYIFTDWLCPPCKKWEPSLERILPSLFKSARVTFIDLAIHPDTQEYIPYDLSFALNDKDNYPRIRQALFNLSANSKPLTEDRVKEALKGLHAEYTKLDKATLAEGIKYFREIAQKYRIEQTPTIVIVNTKTGQKKTFSGLNQLIPDKILETVHSKAG